MPSSVCPGVFSNNCEFHDSFLLWCSTPQQGPPLSLNTTTGTTPVPAFPDQTRASRNRLRTAGSELAWFKGSEGSHDWDYPFDLCGTLYRKKTVERVLSEIEKTDGPAGLSHPNKLETLGNKALARLSEAGAPLLQLARGCLQRRAMVVVTINRVQSVFCNRVFSSHKATDQRHHHDSNSPSHTAGEPGCESDANARDVNALDRYFLLPL